MCGIAGYSGWSGNDPLDRMIRVIAHRGPDGQGQARHGGIGLAACRLSIVDLEGGHQPRSSEDGSLWIAFNGEIYNHAEIAEQLRVKGHRFQSRCDTETVLRAFAEWGPACLERFNGMFAFAIHDRKRDRLFLARDRIGIKPLYVWERGGRLLFGSEIKAILEADAVSRTVRRDKILPYLRNRYVPGPDTLLEGIRSVPPAHAGWFENGRLTLRPYWRLPEEPASQAGAARYQEEFERRFETAVRLRLMSDRPVGTFLSGGLDSGLILAAIAREARAGHPTFSIGFGDRWDESSRAAETAAALAAPHHTLRCEAADLEQIPRLIWNLDQPMGDAIILPMFLLAREASKQVKVVLTGEGGDEVLGGYLFHQVLFWTLRLRRRTPGLLTRIAPAVIRRLPAECLSRGFRYPAGLGESGKRKLLDYLELTRRNDPAAWNLHLRSLFDAQQLQALCEPALAPAEGAAAGEPGINSIEGILRLQYRDWLPDNLLLRLDRMTMAVGIEGRVPFLDHRLVEHLAACPTTLKLTAWRDKIAARRLAARWLPRRVVRRPKQTFYVPLERYAQSAAWRELIGTTLTEQRVRRRGYFRWEAVRMLLAHSSTDDFLSLKRVFALAILEWWHMIFIDREILPA
ncbi:MAG: asparagine synthase (glutamine-hydrolyzing) [Candidatus Omnitrophica bacterium CG11_big_fil_rev_8_21_14_0_20_64_10]|nr:MAG: asparagine synthase (glutamine-hydrolyzing) [Candidatus Omnitrophica bacterium CG11_big_fil_rev_8_21_14_0_20_64_10]